MNHVMEKRNLMTYDETCPPDIGTSMIVYVPTIGRSPEVIERIKAAWAAIIDWGSIYDYSYDFSISESDRMQVMPDWFRTYFKYETVESWQSLYELTRERDWVVWRILWKGHIIKIDINQFSDPVSLGAMTIVIRAAGGNFVTAIDYVPFEDLMEMKLSELNQDPF